MFCSECGKKYTGEGLFCTQCGTRRPDVPPVVPVVEIPAPVVPPVAQPVQQPTSQPIQEQVAPQQKTTSNKTWVFVLLLGIVIGAAIVFGIHLFSREDDSKAEEEASQMQSEPVLLEDDTMDTVITSTPESSQDLTEEPVEEYITTPSQDSMPQEDDAPADMAEVEEDEEIVANAEPTEDLYLLDTDSQFITVNDLRGFTPAEIRLIRNEIYARYGYTFTDSTLQEYFEEQSWYQSNPELNAQTFNNNMLSDIEFTNIELIVEYEASLN